MAQPQQLSDDNYVLGMRVTDVGLINGLVRRYFSMIAVCKDHGDICPDHEPRPIAKWERDMIPVRVRRIP